MRDISVSILLNQGSRYHWKGPLFSLAALLLVLLGWEALALSVTWLRGVAFPTPGETVNKLVDMLAGRPFLDHSIYTHTLDSLGRWGGGFFLGEEQGFSSGWRAAGGLLLNGCLCQRSRFCN